MAIKPLNSVGGFAVGEVPTPIILANGSITTTNITANGIANLGNVANVRIFGGSNGQVLQTDGLGNLAWSSTANISEIHNGDSIVEIPTLNGNIYITANAGTGYQWVFDTTGNLTGPASSTANLGNLVIANYANFYNDLYAGGTANIVGNLTAGNVDGGNLVKANNFSTNGSGGDITLTGGNIVGGNVVVANSFTSNGGVVDFSTNNANVNLGNVPNVHILGGSAGQVLQTDGSGNLSWTSSANVNQIHNGNSNVTIPDVDGNVYINANGGVDQQWNFDTSGVLITPGNITLGGSTIQDNSGGDGIQIYSPSSFAQLNYNNDVYVYTQSNGVWLETNGGGNVHLGTDGNVTMSGNLEVQGNIANANNISATNNISSDTANITNNLTAGSGNITNDLGVGGNLDVGGNIVTGTGSGGNISGVNVLSANVANISDVVNTGKIANGTSNIRLAQDSNVTISVNNNGNVFTFSDLGANVIGYIQANGIISAGGFEGSNLVSNVGILSLKAQQTGGNYNINLLAGGNGNIDVGTTYITSLKDPENPQDAATKYYVDSVAQGLDPKASVHAASNAAISGSYTYNNGTSGVGATLTASAPGVLTLNGENITLGQRVLIKNEVGAYVNDTTPSAAFNGIYVLTTEGTVSAAWVLTRAVDFDIAAEMPGAFTFVETGTGQADTGWVCINNATPPITVGTTEIIFSQFSGAGSYYGTNGILVSGTAISANVDGVTTDIIGGNIAVKDGAQLNYPNIGAATGTSLDLTGNLIAGNVNSNATITAVDASFTGNVEVGGNITTTGSQGNIQGANTIFSDSFVANGGLVDFNTNNSNVQLGSNANVHLYGGSNGQVLQTDGAGNLNWYSISASQIVNGNSNVTIPTTDGNVYINANAGTDKQWAFGTNGTLTFPLVNSQTSIQEQRYGMGNLVGYNDGGWVLGEYNGTAYGTEGIRISPGIEGNVEVILPSDANAAAQSLQLNNYVGNVDINANNKHWLFDNAGNTTFPADGTVNLGNTAATLGNTSVRWGTLTTSSITANQTIATLSVTGVTGIEFLVKAVDAGGAKYSIATVQAVTDGANVDYSTFGSVQLGGYTGSLAVNIDGSNISLQVTPASTNSTVWTTQFRTI